MKLNTTAQGLIGTAALLGVMVLGGCSESSDKAGSVETLRPTTTPSWTSAVPDAQPSPTTTPSKAPVSPSEGRTASPRTITPTPAREAAHEAPVKPQRQTTAQAASKAKPSGSWAGLPAGLVKACKRDGWTPKQCRAYWNGIADYLIEGGNRGMNKEIERQTKKAKTAKSKADQNKVIRDSYKRQKDAGVPLDPGDKNGNGIPDDIDNRKD